MKKQHLENHSEPENVYLEMKKAISEITKGTNFERREETKSIYIEMQKAIREITHETNRERKDEIRQIQQDIVDRFIRHREASGLTRMQLARKIGISTAQITKYEKGHDMSIERFKSLCAAMSITTYDFFNM